MFITLCKERGEKKELLHSLALALTLTLALTLVLILAFNHLTNEPDHHALWSNVVHLWQHDRTYIFNKVRDGL